LENKSDNLESSAPSAGTQVERADPRAQRRAVALVALGAAGGLLVFWVVQSRLPALKAWVAEDPVQVQPRLKLIASGLAAAIAVPALFFAAYFWRLGGRVIRSNQFPPPGMRVIRDTVVWHGEGARRRGRILQGMALILSFIAGGFVTIIWRLVAALFKSRPRRSWKGARLRAGRTRSTSDRREHR